MTQTTQEVVSARRLAARLGLPCPTPEQAAVIEAPAGAAVVIAGAGSGKTETMATRVVWLVANHFVAADAVLGLTFTRKAAAELSARIRRHLKAWANYAEREHRAELLLAEPTVLTYAAYCARLVSDHGLRLGLEPSTRLVSPAAAWQLADAAVRRNGGELDDDIGEPSSVVGYVLQLAGELCDHLQSTESVQRYTDDLLAHIDALPAGPGRLSQYPGELARLVKTARHRRQLLPLVQQFQQDKARSGAADFADYMVWGARLAQLPEVQSLERERYRAVLLDEYQDTGHAQIQLLRNLFSGGHSVTAVGDPFQSIYSWRGASSGNISRFAHDFAAEVPAREFTLSTSWRNDRLILEAANAVAQPLRAVHRSTIELQARSGAQDGTVEAAFLDTVEAEAHWVAHWMRLAWDGMGAARTAAVLVRRRSQIPLLADALRMVGLPVEIVGLGGLLTTPEVADVVATLQVLADHKSGPALLRLLTGARWRIGPRDLVALARRARELALAQSGPTDPSTASAQAGRRSAREPSSIVEALDDLGPPTRFSDTGYQRLAALGQEVHRLRRRISAPLPDLVAEIERTIGVDIEVNARADKTAVGRAHLDRFLDAAADFSVDSDQAAIGAFLAYLDAAEEEENGLAQAEVEVEADRVQILTVHGAKGLEWNAVAVPGLNDEIFPSAARNHDWTRSRQLLPFALRGDAGDLPQLDVVGAEHRRELSGRIKATGKDPVDDLDSALKAVHLLEERRLGYVAFTRARTTLVLSGYAWDMSIRPRSPSAFLTDAANAPGVVTPAKGMWFEPEPGAVNPHEGSAESVAWPDDPLGNRRDAVAEGAALVRAALVRQDPSRPRVADSGAAVLPEVARKSPALGSQDALFPLGTPLSQHAPAPGSPDALFPLDTPLSQHAPAPGSPTVAQWRRDVETLLAERRAAQVGNVRDVELPPRLSVSQLVNLGEDPAEFARRLARPLPLRPAPLARRGTAFHLWLERRWQGERLLDVADLPGAADETAVVDTDLRVLQEAFAASVWADRTPHEVEVPFEMVIGGVAVRGRMDAVFEEPAGPGRERRWLVVDWKTGAVPHGEHARAAAVQLAAYRLAWQQMISTDAAPVELAEVGAAFHYVASNTTVAPSNVLDAAGLRELITGRAGERSAG